MSKSTKIKTALSKYPRSDWHMRCLDSKVAKSVVDFLRAAETNPRVTWEAVECQGSTFNDKCHIRRVEKPS